MSSYSPDWPALKRPLVSCERTSVSNAIQLIRETGETRQADKLDELLGEGEITSDGGLPRRILGLTVKIVLPFFGTIDPDIRLHPNILPRCTTLTRNDLEIIRLAVVLRHEADHALCQGELAAYGNDITWCKNLLRDIGRYFPGTTPAEQAAIQTAIERERDRSKACRLMQIREEARSAARSLELVPGNVYRIGDIEFTPRRVVYPEPSRTTVALLLDNVGEAIHAFKEETDRYPDRLDQLWKVSPPDVHRKYVECVETKKTKKARPEKTIVDPWGYPLIYKNPGQIFAHDFDLYSVGECGVDKSGQAPNTLYPVWQR